MVTFNLDDALPVLSTNRRRSGVLVVTQIEGLVALPPLGRYSELESLDELTWYDSLPATKLAPPVVIQPVRFPSNAPPGAKKYEPVSPQVENGCTIAIDGQLLSAPSFLAAYVPPAVAVAAQLA